jgi:hypothetical protein
MLVEFEINEKIIPLFYGIDDEMCVGELRSKICEEMMRTDYPNLRQHHLTMKYGGIVQPVEAKLSNVVINGGESKWECIYQVSSIPQNSSVACFDTPNYSSSQLLLKDNASVYDVFFHPCGPGAYMPNPRLAIISSELYSDLELNSYEYHLRDLLFPDCWVDAAGGTETNISDQSVQKVLDLVAKRMSEKYLRQTSVRNNKPGFNMVLASSSKQEHYINTTATGGFEVIVLVSEAKGIESSSRNCMLQFLQIAGDAALQLRRFGLAREDCVVIGPICFGEFIQICGVYLLEPCFPVLVVLSDPICCYHGFFKRRLLAKWICDMAAFAEKTLQLVATNRTRLNIPNASIAVEDYFYKPVRREIKLNETTSSETLSNSDASNRRMRADDIMQFYRQLDLIEDSNKYVLFPDGLICLPKETVSESFSIYTRVKRRMELDGFRHVETHAPLLVFRRLKESDGWKNVKPESRYHASYLEQFATAVAVFNSAEVSHLDLRPSNFMWRPLGEDEEDNRVEGRIIDLEDSQRFGGIVNERQVGAALKHARDDYPYQITEGCCCIAGKHHNDWFVAEVEIWLQSDQELFRDRQIDKIVT